MFGLQNMDKVQWIHIGLVLEIGVLLLALILFRFSRVLGGLLDMIQKPPLDGWLKIAGWLLILTFVIPHYIAVGVLYPSRTEPEPAYYLLLFRTLSFVGLFLAGILALIPCLLYYRWTNE
jgi:hypothetical protein